LTTNHLSVVIPVFNESLIIQEIVERVKTNVEFITKDFEILLVDDGSQDQTWELIENEAKKDQRIKGIKFSRNFGHHYAITAGIHHSTGEWVVVMDGDLQDRPEVIPELYEKAQEGFEVVFVSRQNRPESKIYLIAQKTFYWILRIMSGVKLKSDQANFSIISKKVKSDFIKFSENARFYPATINWLGYNSAVIEAEHGIRFAGKPSYTFKRRAKLALDIIFAFSDRPLRLSVLIGIIFSFGSVLSFILVIFRKVFYGFSIVGWTSLFSLTLFSIGLIMFALGIMGIYIGKILTEVKSRQLYVIDEKYNL
jgi:glycosyltransferase involved in cell wall biosynthesis